jgi:hypothetical protein
MLSSRDADFIIGHRPRQGRRRSLDTLSPARLRRRDFADAHAENIATIIRFNERRPLLNEHFCLTLSSRRQPPPAYPQRADTPPI